MTPQDNGCLSFVPGSHKRNRVASRFVRKPDGPGTTFEPVEGVEKADIEWEKERWVTEECPAGTLVLINGLVIHKSERNRSPASRFIYTFRAFYAPGWLDPF